MYISTTKSEEDKMARKIERSELEAERAYYDQTAELWFWSPDGVGGFWYDSLEELEEQHGESEKAPKHVLEILDY